MTIHKMRISRGLRERVAQAAGEKFGYCRTPRHVGAIAAPKVGDEKLAIEADLRMPRSAAVRVQVYTN